MRMRVILQSRLDVQRSSFALWARLLGQRLPFDMGETTSSERNAENPLTKESFTIPQSHHDR